MCDMLRVCMTALVELIYKKSGSDGSKLDLGVDFLKAAEHSVTTDTIVAVIKVKSLKNVSQYAVNGELGPFIEMKLVPSDHDLGDQVQRTSYKPAVSQNMITWSPPERFIFVANDRSAKIRFTLYNFDIRGKHEPLGDVHLFLKYAQPSQVSTLSTMTFVSSATGKQGGDVDLEVTYLTYQQVLNIQEEVVFEYQRWQPVVGWGYARPGNFFPTDPGRWHGEDDAPKRQSDIMEEVIKPLPENWIITKNWYLYIGDGDPDGWQYGFDFKSTSWYTNNSPELLVRRRTWQRVITKRT